ncbi:HNH endonuclease signature motif containing protein [Pseudarthrobacter sp. AB1]|uniref:HNH endonuclease signature motif containing protein n=1 Tax=Pseudarthrobacter sp. AB1 TaxID=2138309 RepID=UPI00186BAB49|nr:HNH endonuclease signature motif containing protein [Pseudarthrobacter sp. AB1]MBE4719843.1 endonuclease [Pseudarthrobacter sp. AB1]
MRNQAVAKAYADITAAVAMLTGVVNEHGSGGLSAEGDPLRGLSEDCLDILIGAAAVDAQMAGVKAGAAVKYADIARAVAPPDASVQAQEMAVTAEVGCALTIGDRAAGSFLGVSHALTNTLPLTMAALQSGTISWQHARVMADEAATLDQAGAAALEAHFLDPDAPGSASGCPAGEMPASRFRHKARTWRERHHAESIEKRHAKGVLDRRVEYAPDHDGMAWLSAYLPADQAAAIWNRTTAIARGLQGPDEPRTLTQLRADALATALLGNGNQGSNGSAEGSDPGQVPPPRAEVLVTVPVFSLLGATDEPAMLDGYGPIPASMARDLVANGAGSFHRVLIDPRDGAPLEIGRSSYRLSKAMQQWLRLRDGKCPFPGCSNNSLDTEADHILAWAKGGTTGVSNLGQPCPKHHKLGHNGGWQPTPATKTEPPGWITPSGRRYASEHQDWEPPHWPNQLKPHEALPDGYPDLVHTGLSLGEEGLERLFHARA